MRENFQLVPYKIRLSKILPTKGFPILMLKLPLTSWIVKLIKKRLRNSIFKELDKQYAKYARKYEGYELKQRLTQVLARKGYDFSDIASALREYL